MNISIYILVNKLKQLSSFSYKGILSNKLNLESILFYNSGEEILENKVYICNPSILHKIPLSTLIISIGPSIVDDSSSCHNIVELDKDLSPFEVFNFIQQIFDNYNKWDNSLQQILNNDGTIDEMIDCSFKIFNNPIIIHTSDFQIMSYSKIMDENSTFDNVLNEELFFDTVNMFKMDPVYNASVANLEPFLFPDHLTGRRSLCINLFKHGQYSHRIVVLEAFNTLFENDFPILQHFSNYVDLLLSKNLTMHTQFYDTLDNALYKIISKEIYGDWNIENSLSRFNWLPEHSYMCTTIKISSIDVNVKTTKSLCKKIHLLIDNCATFLYNEEIVIFINLSKSEKCIEDIEQGLAYFLRDYYLRAGISEQFFGLSEILNYYTQANIALNYGIKKNDHIWLHYFSDVAYYYLLECCTKDLPPHLICSKKLLKLKKYDEDNDTEFYLTLHVYLKNFLNAVKSAKQLFIHRSTFLYRIKKIKELVDIDFDYSDDIIYLLISYKLLDRYLGSNDLNIALESETPHIHN